MINQRLLGNSTENQSGMSRAEFIRRVLIVAGIAVLSVALVWVFVKASDVFFLFFLAILLAILLRTTGDALARRIGIGEGWSLTVVVIALLALTAGVGYVLGATVVKQFDQFTTALPKSFEQSRLSLLQHEWGRQVLDAAPPADKFLSASSVDIAGRVTALFSTTLGALGDLLLLVFLTLYLAASPGTYREGLLQLVPPRHRPRTTQVLAAVGFHLKWWMLGRLLVMIAVGIITGIGLWIIGVPQFLILAIVATLLTAIPYLGAIISVIPALLLTIPQGPTVVLWTLVVYTLAQAVEGYLLIPLIQQKTVRVPAVVTIAALALIGGLFGVIGLIAATPLSVAILVLVKMLYVEDVLGEPLDVPGEKSAVTTV